MTHAARVEEARDLCDFGPAFDLSDFDIDPKYRHLIAGRWEHYRTCGVCQGSGEITVNRSHNNDPQRDECYDCPNPDCVDGYVTVWTDPLILLRDARRQMLRFRRSPTANMLYGGRRNDATSPVLLPDSVAPFTFRRAA
jgi:hypothetical protein